MMTDLSRRETARPAIALDRAVSVILFSGVVLFPRSAYLTQQNIHLALDSQQFLDDLFGALGAQSHLDRFNLLRRKAQL